MIIDYLNLSCPAVSQICNFIFCPATSIILVPNSTPIVCGQSAITRKQTMHADICIIQIYKPDIILCTVQNPS